MAYLTHTYIIRYPLALPLSYLSSILVPKALICMDAMNSTQAKERVHAWEVGGKKENFADQSLSVPCLLYSTVHV